MQENSWNPAVREAESATFSDHYIYCKVDVQVVLSALTSQISNRHDRNVVDEWGYKNDIQMVVGWWLSMKMAVDEMLIW